ncbi:MAG: ribonuclease III [Alphaproteobacteria bacterium]|nr:ribonuclease III [Alphaproteobacteria bacterium]
MKTIENNLNYTFKDKMLISAALHHSSIKKSKDFERLEFLGDRVLGLIIAEYIYDKFKEPEGKLSRRHAAAVCADSCCEVATRIGIHQKIQTAHKELKNNKTVLADAMEAIIGAILLDSDYNTAKSIVLNMWQNILLSYQENLQEPKTRLQEIVQKKSGELPEYKVISMNGPQHSLTFTVQLTALGSEIVTTGRSKKEAETVAALEMLKKLGNLP